MLFTVFRGKLKKEFFFLFNVKVHFDVLVILFNVSFSTLIIQSCLWIGLFLLHEKNGRRKKKTWMNSVRFSQKSRRRMKKKKHVASSGATCFFIIVSKPTKFLLVFSCFTLKFNEFIQRKYFHYGDLF
jgi:hypothetical protein